MFPTITACLNSIILVFESGRFSISKEVKAHEERRKMLFYVIPDDLSSILHPADTCIFKSLNENLSYLAEQWLNS